MVREGGVEPPHRKALDPKSSASTSSATLAHRTYCYDLFINVSRANLLIELLFKFSYKALNKPFICKTEILIVPYDNMIKDLDR